MLTHVEPHLRTGRTRGEARPTVEKERVVIKLILTLVEKRKSPDPDIQLKYRGLTRIPGGLAQKTGGLIQNTRD